MTPFYLPTSFRDLVNRLKPLTEQPIFSRSKFRLSRRMYFLIAYWLLYRYRISQSKIPSEVQPLVDRVLEAWDIAVYWLLQFLSTLSETEEVPFDVASSLYTMGLSQKFWVKGDLYEEVVPIWVLGLMRMTLRVEWRKGYHVPFSVFGTDTEVERYLTDSQWTARYAKRTVPFDPDDFSDYRRIGPLEIEDPDKLEGYNEIED